MEKIILSENLEIYWSVTSIIFLGISLPFSKVISFISIIIGDNTNIFNILQSVANSNTQNQINNIYYNNYNNITSYPAAIDSVYNNAWIVNSTNSLNLEFPKISAGICASNGLVSQSRSCAGCCGN